MSNALCLTFFFFIHTLYIPNKVLFLLEVRLKLDF